LFAVQGLFQAPTPLIFTFSHSVSSLRWFWRRCDGQFRLYPDTVSRTEHWTQDLPNTNQECSSL